MVYTNGVILLGVTHPSPSKVYVETMNKFYTRNFYIKKSLDKGLKDCSPGNSEISGNKYYVKDARHKVVGKKKSSDTYNIIISGLTV